MRRTLFWTCIYATVAFVFIGAYNLWYDVATTQQIDPNHVPSIRTFQILNANQEQIIDNQQITHSLTIAILIFLIVRLYYEKHPKESTNAATLLVNSLKNKNGDIPASYFEDGAKTVEERKQEL